MAGSSQQFDALFERSPIAHEYYDSKGRVVTMNRAALDLFGAADTSDLENNNLFTNPHFPPDLRDRLLMGKVVEFDVEYDFGRVRYDTAKEGLLYLHVVVFPIHGPDEEPEGYLLQILDLTKKHRALKKLRASEERYKTLLENLNVGWLLADEDLVVMEFRPTPEHLTGLTEKQVVGRRITDVAEEVILSRGHPTPGEQSAKLLHSVLDGKGPLKLCKIPIRRSGTHREGFIDITAFKVVIERSQHVACLVMDVTELEVMQEQLVQAQKMESVGRLASGIAHDFNNLLTAILGNVGLIELDSSDEEQIRTCTRDIKTAAEKASALTKRMSRFSCKKHAGEETVDMSALAETTVAILERAVPESVNVVLDTPPVTPTFEGDPTRLESALMNMCINALDAMPGGGELRLSTSVVRVNPSRPGTNPAVGDGKWLRLSVNDTGTGMDEQTRERVFEPFFTTKEPGRGTGLGLYSVYSTVKDHGGTITIASKPGEGTTFDIYFPLLTEEPDRSMKRDSRPSIPPLNV